MKNPMALTMKDKIVKVSVLSQRKRCETGIASHIGSTNCITTPSSHASKPYKNNSSPTTLAIRIFLIESPLHAILENRNIIIKLTETQDC